MGNFFSRTSEPRINTDDENVYYDADCVDPYGLVSSMAYRLEFRKNVLKMNKFDINSILGHGNTALLLSSFIGDCSLIELCLNRGANINHRNSKGNTALIYACMRMNKEAIELLVRRGAEVNMPEGLCDKSALAWCCSNYGKDEDNLVNLLLEKGAKDVTAIHSAACYGLRKSLELLIKNIPYAQEDLDIALVEASSRRRGIEVIGLLIESGANVNVLYKHNTPLMWASLNGLYENVVLLLYYGADINQEDSVGNTALIVAILDSNNNRSDGEFMGTSDRNLDVIRLLITKGADLHGTIKMETPLCIFLRHRLNFSEDMVKLFCEYGAPRDEEAMTLMTEEQKAFYIACMGPVGLTGPVGPVGTLV